jgi:hypothetical protein
MDPAPVRLGVRLVAEEMHQDSGVTPKTVVLTSGASGEQGDRIKDAAYRIFELANDAGHRTFSTERTRRGAGGKTHDILGDVPNGVFQDVWLVREIEIVLLAGGNVKPFGPRDDLEEKSLCLIDFSTRL